MIAKVKRSFDLSDIYVKERAAKRENSRLNPNRVLNHKISIAS